MASRICVKCDNETTKFDERNSSTFIFNNVVIDQDYGKGSIYGYLSHDQVCVKPDKCADDFSFLSVGVVEDISKVNGIVGLSPFKKGLTADSFLKRLKTSGTIDVEIFSFLINFEDKEKSKMTFGGYDLQNFAAFGSNLIFH